MGLYDYLATYTAPSILQSALNQITANVDKREGAVIYDTLAPLAVIAARIIGIMQTALENTDLQTASGSWLDLIASQPPACIYRNTAQAAQKSAQAKPIAVDIALGARFTTQNGMGNAWIITEKLSAGRYVLTCETAGAEPGGDYGELTPDDSIDGLESLSFEDVAPVNRGKDEEDDEEFRLRIWQNLKRNRYGGNFNDYMSWIFSDFANNANGGTLDGVQFFPASRYIGGGHIRIYPTAPDKDGNKYMPASAELCDRLKMFLDPPAGNLNGVGAGVAPVGHCVDVVQPDTDGWNLDISVILRTGRSEITDADREAATKNLYAYFEEIRGELVSELGESFPNAGDSGTGYETTVYIDRIKSAATGGGAIFQSAQAVLRNGEGATDTTYTPGLWGQASQLPVISSINIHTDT